MSRRPRRRLRLVVFALLGVWALYVLAVNVFLNTSLASKAINRRPAKFTLGWDSGWSIIPGRIHLSTLTFNLHGRRQDFRVTADRAFANIAVLKLPWRRFATQRLDIEGLLVAISRDPDPPAGPRPARSQRPPGWRIELRNVDVERIEGFSFLDVDAAGGEGHLKADFLSQVRGDLAMERVDLNWNNVVLRKGDAVVAQPLAIRFAGGISPLDPKKEKGLAVLDFLSGRLEVSGDVERLSILRRFIERAKWIQTLDGKGNLEAKLHLEDGRIVAGSELKATADNLRLDFLGYAAEGTGRVLGTVTDGPEAPKTVDKIATDPGKPAVSDNPDPSAPAIAVAPGSESREEQLPGRLARMEVVFDDFSVRRKPAMDPYVHGQGLRLVATSNDPFLRDGMNDLDIVLDMPQAKVPDMAVYGAYLPEHLGLKVDSGTGLIRLHLEGSAVTKRASGELELLADDVKGHFQDLEFEGALETHTKISGGDLDNFHLEIIGTRMAVKDVILRDGRNTEEQGWWMTLDVSDGTLEIGEAPRLAAEFDVLMKDTRAVMALFGEVKPWADRFERLLTIKDIQAHASIAMAPQQMTLRDLGITGRKLQGRAELELAKDQRRGILYVRFHGIPVGLEILGKKRDWKLIKPKAWFERRVAADWSATDGQTLEASQTTAGKPAPAVEQAADDGVDEAP